MITNWIYIAWICLLVFGPGDLLLGQSCEAMRQAAKQIGKERLEAQGVNEDLKQAFEEKLQAMQQLGLDVPADVLTAMPRLSPTLPRYQDDRGNCRIGRITWGTVKDLREYKRDSLEQENRFILDRIKQLSAILDETQGSPAPAPVAARQMGALQAQRMTFRNRTYSYCLFDPKQVDLRLDHRRSPQAPHGFQLIADVAAQEGNELLFAMNAGMYQPNKAPVGLLIADGREWGQLNVKRGKGNFYMDPNGVFGVLTDGRPFVVSTRYFAKNRAKIPPLRLATQSGPMLLVQGKINPAFTPNSPNVHFRNAVGVIKETGQVVCVISEQQVCFHDLAAFMQELGCWQALYLDGVVSRMYVPALNKTQDLSDSQHLGPILYILHPTTP